MLCDRKSCFGGSFCLYELSITLKNSENEKGISKIILYSIV